MTRWRRARTGEENDARATRAQAAKPRSRFERIADRWSLVLRARVPRGSGLAATALVIVASLVYGVIRGGHLPAVVAGMKDARDALANAAGFRIRSIALAGNRHVNREEILAIAGITGTTSLLFLDVDHARDLLKANPWIADASVLKLYPGELQIGIKEREAFALWQKDGRVAVIAHDGTVLEPYVAPQLIRLPLVVGRGADARARDFLALLERYPDLRIALDRLARLEREKQLSTRDITVIDLRLSDRVTVRLSERAAQARAEALKEKKPARKGRET